MSRDDELLDWGERTGARVRGSADALDGSTRSRLSRARAAAVEQAGRGSSWWSQRLLLPAGALASAALLAVILLVNPPGEERLTAATSTPLQDLDLLTDSDAWLLSEEADMEFIEWAAGMSELEGAGG